MKIALFVLLAGLATSAQAQSPEPASPPADDRPPAADATTAALPAEPSTTDTAATVISGDRLADAPDSKRRCIRDTGTRLRKRDAHGCTGAPGESYDREAIDRTGAIDTADALRKLTTSGTVRRGR